MKRFVWCICLLLVVLLGCQRPAESGKTEEERKVLACIDDSVEAMSAHAPEIIKKALASATDSLTYYEYYVRKAKYFCLSATPDSMYPILDKTISYCKLQPATERRNSLLAYAYNCKAIAYHNYRKNPDEVIRLYKDATTLLANSDAKDQMPKVCANLGDAYIFKSQLPEAAACYRRALFLVDSLGLPSSENITLYLGLATIYLQLNDFETSLKYYQQTEKYFSQMSVGMQAYYLNNYGNYYYYTKNYKASLQKFLAMKAFLEKHHKTDTFDMYLCKLNLADVYLNLDKVALSEKYLDEIEPWFAENGNEVSIYYVNSIRIGQAVKQGNMAKVKDILSHEKGSDSMEFSLRQIRNRYLRKYYEAIGDYRGAYDNLRTDVQQNDSLEHNRIKMRASEIMDRFAQDTIRLHHNLEMEHKNAVVQRAYAITVAAVSLVVVIILIFALLVMRSRKRNAQDKMRNMQLRLACVRNRISPHFVFNVLNGKILKSDEHDANDLLDLTKLIRANLDLSCRLDVTLREELDFVKRYVDVEKQLVGDDFEFAINIDESVNIDQVRIPSMQILVENAFVHGLKGWDGHKIIHIGISKEGKNTCIKVRDNGPGFDIRSVGKKRTGLNVITQTIVIVNERNKNKMNFSLNNEQENGKAVGCVATIVIPDNIKLFI